MTHSRPRDPKEEAESIRKALELKRKREKEAKDQFEVFVNLIPKAEQEDYLAILCYYGAYNFLPYKKCTYYRSGQAVVNR